MDDVKEFMKKYWPYVLGAIVGIYLIYRYSGGSSSGTSNSDYAAFLQAQSNAAVQNAQLQAQQAQLNLQAKAQADQLELDKLALNAQMADNAAKLEIQKMAVQADAFNNFTTAQAAMAASVGSSTAATINALNAPAMTAMQANAAENAAAMNAAANVAAASFFAQSEMVGANAIIPGGLASAVGQVQLMPYQNVKGTFGTVSDAAIRGYSAYMSGGMSEMGRSDSSGQGSLYYPQNQQQSGGTRYVSYV